MEVYDSLNCTKNRIADSLPVKIKDLRPHMENVIVVARVLSETQEVEIRGKKYASAIIEDKTDLPQFFIL